MSRKNPLVSVVIPSYNHLEYVEIAIRSVTSQTYSNIELIVVDDGSTDGSIDKISALNEIHSFTFYSQENRGLSKTLNDAISKCSGEYVAILASDDYYHINKIEEQMKVILKTKNSEFCYVKTREFDSESGASIREFPNSNFEGCVLNRIFFRQPYCAGTILFSKKLYNDVGGFDESLKYEDWDFSIRCAAKTKFCRVDKVLFFYRSHASNVTKVMARRAIFQQKIKTLAKNYHLVSPSVWFFSVLINFFYDHLLFKVKGIKGILH